MESNLNKTAVTQDRTVRLAGGHTQAVDMLIAGGAKGRTRGLCDVKVKIDLPPGMTLIRNLGVYQATQESHETTPQGRNVYLFNYRIDFTKSYGSPQAEWNNNTLFVQVPDSIAPDQSYIELTADESGETATRRYPLELTKLAPAAKVPKKITVGMWDYTYARAGAAAAGIADFLNKTGIRWTSTGNKEFSDTMAKSGIAVGGDVHHNYFYNKDWQDEGYKGTRSWGGFPCTYCVSQLPEETPLNGVDKLVEAADRTGGWATYDFEPTGMVGFCPKAVEAFRNEYKISEEEFKTFRDFLVKHDRIKTDRSKDPVVSKVWTAWGEFRTRHSDEYARRIYKQFKARRPNAKLALTPSGSYLAGSPMARLHGCNQSGLTAGADVIMPQTYRGYDAAGTKLGMIWTDGWKREVARYKPDTELWAMILARYAGAWGGNTPERLRQQMVGMVAEGADGLVFYYPGTMTAPHWQAVADTVAELAEYEDYYVDGKRCEAEFKLSGVPRRTAQTSAYPEMMFDVVDPEFCFYAHEKDGKVLLTMINLSGEELTFQVDTGKRKAISNSVAATPVNGGWKIGAGKIGYVLLNAK